MEAFFTQRLTYRSFSMGRGRKGAEAFPWLPVILFDEDRLIMANIRALATTGLLVTFGSGASVAMPPQDLPSRGQILQGHI